MGQFQAGNATPYIWFLCAFALDIEITMSECWKRNKTIFEYVDNNWPQGELARYCFKKGITIYICEEDHGIHSSNSCQF